MREGQAGSVLGRSLLPNPATINNRQQSECKKPLGLTSERTDEKRKSQRERLEIFQFIS
jgi:hypothetical protein